MKVHYMKATCLREWVLRNGESYKVISLVHRYITVWQYSETILLKLAVVDGGVVGGS